jgi:hypothetical protein
VRTIAIDLNDAGLVVADAEIVLAVEPGYALVEDRKITTGTAAYAEARLKPRRISNRFWSTLSAAPGTAGVRGVDSAAELAFAQLREIWSRFGGAGTEVVFVVPGNYTREQLGLLLGLAQECGMPVRALVDAAVAASVQPYPGRQLLFLDAGLHRTSVTPIEQGEEAVALSEQGIDAGRADLVDSLARWFAEVFVLATRFDPFHHAETEQRLYDCLPDWLASLRSADSAEVALTHGGDEFRVTVAREQLLGVVAGFGRALVQLIAQVRAADAGLVVQVSERLADLPGLETHLGRLDDVRLVRLAPGHSARAVLAGIDSLERGGSVKLLKHLPWRAEAAEEAAGAPAAAEPAPAAFPQDDRPTHVVYAGIAHALAADGLVVGRETADGRRTIVVDGGHGGLSRSHFELVVRDGELKLRDLSRHGTFVNERRVAGEAVLKIRDVIRIGSPGVELEVIRVED